MWAIPFMQLRMKSLAEKIMIRAIHNPMTFQRGYKGGRIHTYTNPNNTKGNTWGCCFFRLLIQCYRVSYHFQWTEIKRGIKVCGTLDVPHDTSWEQKKNWGNVGKGIRILCSTKFEHFVLGDSKNGREGTWRWPSRQIRRIQGLLWVTLICYLFW